MLLVSERLRTRVFNHVIKNAQAPLMIGPRPIRFLKYTKTLKSHIPFFLGLDVSLGMSASLRPNIYNLNNSKMAQYLKQVKLRLQRPAAR